MTERRGKAAARGAALPPILALFALLLWKNEVLAEGIRAGMLLAGHTVIPVLFPFAVLAPYLPPLLAGKSGRGLPPSALVLAVGLLCGFPLGAKLACDGAHDGLWSRQEAERMLCFCNNTSIAFLLGVGGHLRGSVRDGILLVCVQLLVASLIRLLLTLVYRDARQIPHQMLSSAMPLPTFTDAVRGAIGAALTVTAYIAFFSGISAVLGTIIPASIFPYLVAWLEVGTACRALAKVPHGLSCTAFAILFSGVSVHLQTASVAQGSGVRLLPAVLCKAAGGILGAALTELFLRFAS